MAVYANENLIYHQAPSLGAIMLRDAHNYRYYPSYWGVIRPNFSGNQPTTILKISGVNYPIQKKSGDPFSVYGTISSAYLLTNGSAYVIDSAGKVYFGIGTYTEHGRTSFNLHDWDQDMRFASLPAGKYSYVVEAADARGYYVSKSFPFTVGAAATTSGTAGVMTGKHSCDAMAGTAYTWDSGTITQQPTCTEKGSKKYVCRECKNTKTVEIAALGHAYSTEWTVDVQPGETSVGYKSHHCIRCGAKADVTEIPAKGQAELAFDDVQKGTWYYEAVQYTVENELFVGMSETSFAPELVMNRAMLVSVLWRMEGEPEASTLPNPFTDVEQDKWYTVPIKWAYAKKVVYGTEVSLFSPDQLVTREQMVAILFRYTQQNGHDHFERSDLTSFPDVTDVSGYAKEAFSWANAFGVVSGTDRGGTAYLNPKGPTTRAQMASVLMRYHKKVLF